MKVTISSKPERPPTLSWDDVLSMTDQQLVVMHQRTQQLLSDLSVELRLRLEPTYAF
jgi:hypothetical protein